MLTKGDLKHLGEAIKSETEPRFSKIDRSLRTIHKSIKNLTDFVKFFDREHQDTRKKVDRIKDYLKLPKIS